MKKVNLIALSGVINIAHITLAYSIGFIYIAIINNSNIILTTEQETTILLMVGTLIPMVVLIFSNCILFVIVGIYNKENSGYLLILNGLFYSVFVSAFGYLYFVLSTDPFLFNDAGFTNFMNVFLILGTILAPASRALLLFYSVKEKHRLLAICSLILLGATIYYFFTSRINIFWVTTQAVGGFIS